MPLDTWKEVRDGAAKVGAVSHAMIEVGSWGVCNNTKIFTVSLTRTSLITFSLKLGVLPKRPRIHSHSRDWECEEELCGRQMHGE